MNEWMNEYIHTDRQTDRHTNTGTNRYYATPDMMNCERIACDLFLPKERKKKHNLNLITSSIR